MNKIILLFLVLTISACATKLEASREAVLKQEVKINSKDEFKKQFSIGVVKQSHSGEAVGPFYGPIPKSSLAETLTSTLKEAGYLSDAVGNYVIDAELLDLDTSESNFATVDTESKVEYNVAGPGVSRKFAITEMGYADPLEAYLAGERVQRAKDRSLKNNTKQFLSQLIIDGPNTVSDAISRKSNDPSSKDKNSAEIRESQRTAQKLQSELEEKLRLAEIQRVESELKAKKLDEERIRLTKERELIEADRVRREQVQLREQEDRLKLTHLEALTAQTGKRLALVIGNSKYIHRPLKNPINDADDISRALKLSNFDVIDLRDATLPQIRAAVRQFGDKLLNNDVGLVYYSGHGVEVKGKNYFLPVNADIQREDEIADQGLDVALILEKMTTAGKGVNILIVDACRDDPFGRSFRSSSKGLATMDAPRGTIIAYATSPGKVASDGDGRNSPYTRALVQAMQVPNKPIEQVFKDVRRSVQAETKNQQTPWENTSLSGDFYFRVQR